MVKDHVVVGEDHNPLLRFNALTLCRGENLCFFYCLILFMSQVCSVKIMSHFAFTAYYDSEGATQI